MKYSKFISNIFRHVGMIAGTELIDRSQIVSYINYSLGTIESLNNWFFLRTWKTITTTSPTEIFTLPTELFNILYVSADNTQSYQTIDKPSSLAEYNLTYKEILFGSEATEIKIYGDWGFEKVENTDDYLNKEMDFPKMIESALHHFVLAHVFPHWLSDGEGSASFHYNFAADILKAYAKRTQNIMKEDQVTSFIE